MNQTYGGYLEQKILSADPVELVRMLYQAAVEHVINARRYLAERDIPRRAQSISSACDILGELASSLRTDRGGDIAKTLNGLYAYMRARLLDATVQQSDEPLAEVLKLLTTLAEAWQQVPLSSHSANPTGATRPVVNPSRFAPEYAGTAEYAPQSWSL